MERAEAEAIYDSGREACVEIMLELAQRSNELLERSERQIARLEARIERFEEECRRRPPYAPATLISRPAAFTSAAARAGAPAWSG